MPSLSGYSRPTQYVSPPDALTTLKLMASTTQRSLLDTRLRLFAERLVRNVFPHDYLSEYAAVLNWVRTNIRYSRDPFTIEQVKTPQVVLETETGDCDDQAVLAGALVGQLGAKVRFVAGAFAKDTKGQPVLAHVWCEAYDPMTRCWVILDPVPGRSVSTMINKLIDSVSIMAIG